MDPRHQQLFDAVTGDLLPQYREAYLHSRLTPAAAQAVEEYLKNSPIQKAVLLGRYHELAEEARRQRRSFAAPVWVQQQLIFQPSVSKVGPLRRPVVRLALGLFLALSLASIVQWIRNEPLVPAPVAAAVVRAATHVSETTQRLTRSSLVSLHLSEPIPPADSVPAPAARPAVAASGRRPAATSRPAPISPALARPVAVVLTDSATTAAADIAPSATDNAVVKGRICNQDGEPLAGATVLVVGSQIATSANANGEYVLEVPPGALLQFAYAGCPEKLLHYRLNAPLNVMLEEPVRRRHAAL